MKKKEYQFLKQFFEHHKTLHSYESFIRHRSSERLRQLDEICSNHPYKTRFEEFEKIVSSDEQSYQKTFLQRIRRLQNAITGNGDEDSKSSRGWLVSFLIWIAFSLAIFFKNFYYFTIPVLVLLILFFLFFPIHNYFETRNKQKVEKIRRNFIFVKNYYGLNQYYNYSVGLISFKSAEEFDICLQKFCEDIISFYTENQEKISLILNFFYQTKPIYINFIPPSPKIKEIRDWTIDQGLGKKIIPLMSCYECRRYETRNFRNRLSRFKTITKDYIDNLYNDLKEPNAAISESYELIDLEDFKNNFLFSLKDDTKENLSNKLLLYSSWIFGNIVIGSLAIMTLLSYFDLKNKAITPLFQQSYAQYEKDLNIWENGVLVKINTSMTDYYRLGEDISYGYKINGIDVSNNSIIEMPEDNIFDFIVSVTEYDDTFDDHGYSEESITLTRQDIIKGYRVVLETYVHENGKYSNQGYASFKTKFILSLPDDNNKPKEPHKSDFNDKVSVTFSDAFKSAIGLE